MPRRYCSSCGTKVRTVCYLSQIRSISEVMIQSALMECEDGETHQCET